MLRSSRDAVRCLQSPHTTECVIDEASIVTVKRGTGWEGLSNKELDTITRTNFELRKLESKFWPKNCIQSGDVSPPPPA
jgi:hypothetical protein